MSPRRSVLAVLVTVLGTLAFGSAPALAAAPEAPEASVETPVHATEATFHGVVNPKVATFPVEAGTWQFVYRPSTKAEDKCKGTGETLAPASAGMYLGLEPESFSDTVTGLTANTEYAVCLVAEDAGGKTASTPPVSFTTALHPETPTGLEANPIAATTATLNAVLNPAAPGNPGSYAFLYRPSGSTPAACQGEGEVATSASTATGALREPAAAKLAELQPNTSYTFCLRASNEAGEATLSAPVAFRTLPEAYATDLASSSATLHGTLDPEGATLSYHFEYGTGTGYGSQSPEAVTTLAGVEAHLQGLAAGTLYHYRLLATNAANETFASEDETFTTQQLVGEFTLPDVRQYEMVTPPAKEGAKIRGLSHRGLRVIQASADGDAIVNVANEPTEAKAKGDDSAISVLSTRGPGGWSSQDIAGPHDEAGGIEFESGGESRFFSEDLSHAVTMQHGLFTAFSPEASEPTPYLRTNYFDGDVNDRCEGSYLTAGSCFQPLVTRANTRTGAVFGETLETNGVCIKEFCGPGFLDGTPDLSHIILSSREALTSNSVKRSVGVNDYEWSGGQLQLLPGAIAGRPGGGANGNTTGGGELHAISSDGGRVIVEDVGLDLYEVATGETVRLDATEPGCNTCDNSGHAEGGIAPTEFMNASSDDSRIFFRDEDRLTANSGAVTRSTKGEALEDLYECEIVEVAGKHKCNLTDLTPPAVAGGEPANVQAVLGVSEDGSYVYFAAGGALAPGAVPDGCHSNGQGSPHPEGCNVYVRHDGVTRLVSASWITTKGENGSAGEAAEVSRVSLDGRWLAFMSAKSLTGYDNRDAVSGQPDDEVFLYHAETSPSGTLEPGELTCASCNPTGARPVGELEKEDVAGWVAASVPEWTDFTEGEDRYQPRYLSDGGRLFFDSNDALVPQDVNGVGDVYEYEPEGVPASAHACSSSSVSGSEVFEPAHAFTAGGVRGETDAGCVALISSGTSSEPSTFIDASAGSGFGEHGEAGSEGGRDVFFLTTSKLAPQDLDTAPDVYDAHECTSASSCATGVVAPPTCTTEASCKPPPTPQPGIYGLPASATFSGPGNVTPTSPPPSKPAVKSLTRAQKLANALKSCKRDRSKKKRTTCERQARKNYGASKAKKSTHQKGSK